jgi:Right handed beta helix region
MRQARQWCGRGFIYPVLCMLAYLMVVLEGSFVRAVGQTGDPPRPPAALLLQKDGIHDLGGQVIRCQPGEEVGIWAESSVSLTIANVVIEGCEVGIVVTGGATNNTRGEATQGVTPNDLSSSADIKSKSGQRWSAHVEGARMRVTTIGIFLAGNGSTVVSNIVGGARYGIVVTGDDNTLINNQSNDNLKDGFLVTGDRNLLEGNEARRNGGVGIHVARMVPMVGDNRFLSFIQDRGLSNVIRGNTALDNKRDLVEFADCADPPFPPLSNEWTNNIFRTRRPNCIE